MYIVYAIQRYHTQRNKYVLIFILWQDKDVKVSCQYNFAYLYNYIMIPLQVDYTNASMYLLQNLLFSADNIIVFTDEENKIIFPRNDHTIRLI